LFRKVTDDIFLSEYNIEKALKQITKKLKQEESRHEYGSKLLDILLNRHEYISSTLIVCYANKISTLIDGQTTCRKSQTIRFLSQCMP